jgi:energy-converting hydrogenase Eha subunit G
MVGVFVYAGILFAGMCGGVVAGIAGLFFVQFMRVAWFHVTRDDDEHLKA